MTSEAASPVRAGGIFAPLRHAAFRRVWSASLLSNFGLMINGVGAGWAMTQLSGRADKVALVQAALMLPYMLFAIPAGAISDTYDRRKVGIIAICAAILVAGMLFWAALADMLDPGLLLLLCFLIGSANAMFGPVWQSSVGEQVPAEDLPQGIALNSVSYNIARSFGPAAGGLLVALWGPVAAFGGNMLCYVPMLGAQLAWKRRPEVPRLPPEHVRTAILSGLRYVIHFPAMRAVLLRSLLFGIAGGSISSLMPLISRDLLHGGPRTYGTLLGAFGMGAVIGAMLIPRLRDRLSAERHAAGSMVVVGLGVLILSVTGREWIAAVVLLVAGMGWMQALTVFSVAIQARAPRWVTGRAVAAYQAATAGGLAIGSWLWGHVADSAGTQAAVAASAIAMIACAPFGRWLRVVSAPAKGDESAGLGDPESALDITGRSGPVVVVIEYRIAMDHARRFHEAMNDVRRIRQRNGAYGWSLARDIAEPELWIERFHCPTWHDYLRQRERMTAPELEVARAAMGIDPSGGQVRVRRLLERPFGSVRWSPDSPDRGLDGFAPGTGHLSMPSGIFRKRDGS